MIPRRIAEHVKAQNWFAVGIDFVIVVIGVFVGLQVSNWNAALADHRRIERRLFDLATDLEDDREEIVVALRSAGWRLSPIEAVLKGAGYQVPQEIVTPQFGMLKAPAAAPLTAEAAAYANSTIYVLSTFDGTQRTYDSLVSTGDFQLLRDVNLAHDIQAYYRAVTEMRDFEQRHTRLSERLIESRNRAGILSSTTLAELAQKARDNPEFAADLEIVWRLGVYQIVRAEELDKEAARLVAAIRDGDR